MEDKQNEEENLRKQIAFLKNLISSAQNKQNTRNAHRGNYSYSSIRSHRMPVKGNSDLSCAPFDKKTHHSNIQNSKDPLLYFTDDAASYGKSKQHSSDQSSPSGKKLSKYTWCKSKTLPKDSHAHVHYSTENSSGATNVSSSEVSLVSSIRKKQAGLIASNIAIKQEDSHSVSVKSEPLEFATCSTEVDSSPSTNLKNMKVEHAASLFPNENSYKDYSKKMSTNNLVQHKDKSERQTSYRTVPYSLSARPPKSNSLDSAVKKSPSKQIDSASSLQKSIQQKLLNTEKAIQDLKKDIEKMQKASLVEQQGKTKLQCLSPYKMQKVPCYSSTVSIQEAEYRQNTVLSPLNKSFDVEVKASPENSHMKIKKEKPSKLIVKTRYAIKRERHSSNSKTPSKSSLHTLFNESDDSKTKGGVTSCSSRLQHAAKAVKHKYKYWPQRDARYQNQWTRGSCFSHDPKYQKHKGPLQFHKSRKSQMHRSLTQSIQGYQWGQGVTGRYRGHHSKFTPTSLQWNNRYKQQCGRSRKGYTQKEKWLRENVPFDPRMKVDRRIGSPQKDQRDRIRLRAAIKELQRQIETALRPDCNKNKIKYARAAGTKIVTYRRSSSHNKDVTYSIGRNGKKLTRLRSTDKLRHGGTLSNSRKAAQRSREQSKIQVQGITYVESVPGVWEKSHAVKTRKLARRVINRSKANLAARHKKERKLCMFYNRFGNCRKGSSCRDIHDPDKVAVCTKFLRSVCYDKNCRFSHKTTKEKMPVCLFFLKGNCNRDDCPYSHMNVSKDAEVCADFLCGYCSQGEKCKKKHILVCEEFSKTGKCSLGRKCQLQHRAKKSSSRNKHDNSSTNMKASSVSELDPSNVVDLTVVKQEPVSDSEQEGDQAGTIKPSLDRKLPAYISLNLKKEKDDPQQASSSNSGVTDAGQLHLKLQGKV